MSDTKTVSITGGTTKTGKEITKETLDTGVQEDGFMLTREKPH